MDRVPGPSHRQSSASTSNSSQTNTESSNTPSAKKKCNGFGDEGGSCQVENTEALISKIANLYAERLMSDIILVIDEQRFPAHRLILCASSDVFQVMLMDSRWTESQKSTVVLKETPECAKIFEYFLKYLYTGSLQLTLQNVVHLLTLGDKYNVKDLITLCLSYMRTNIPSAGRQHCLIPWYHYTFNCGHDGVADACRNFIKWNFDDMCRANDFYSLDMELLVSILLDDDIVIHDEYTLFRFAEHWIRSQSTQLQGEPDAEERMHHIVREVMSCIRYPLISMRQLIDLLLSPLTDKYPFVTDFLKLGLAFHQGCSDKLQSFGSDYTCKENLFVPRLYTTEKWAVCMNVERFSSMAHYSSKTLVFSTPASFADSNGDKQVEWVLELFPKGVWYMQHSMIIWNGVLTVPEAVMRTIRLSLVCRNEEDTEIRVQIGILLIGSQDDEEHVIKCIKKSYIFGKDDRVNFDDLIPYGDLNKCAACNYRFSHFPPTSDPSGAYSPPPNCCDSPEKVREKSHFLVGPHKDSLKIKIVITPQIRDPCFVIPTSMDYS